MKNENETPAKLFVALIAAQKSIQGVVKTGKNTHQKYAYATTESMIRECREALHGQGLTLITTASTILDSTPPTVEPEWVKKLGNGREGIATMLAALHPTHLAKEYLLVHESGEVASLRQQWPIFVENGRGPDKAVAAALTASLGYFLRDLLLIPRVNSEDELDSDATFKAKQAEEAAKQAAPKKKAATKKKSYGAEKDAALDEVRDRMKLLRLKPDDVAGWAAKYDGKKSPAELSVAELVHLKESLQGVLDGVPND